MSFPDSTKILTFSLELLMAPNFGLLEHKLEFFLIVYTFTVLLSVCWSEYL